MKNPATFRKTFIAVSMVLFLFSLGNKCYCTTNNCADAVVVLLIGWLGVIFGGAALVWLANPMLILTWILTRKDSKYALGSSLITTMICLSFLLFDSAIDNEAGHYNKIISYQAGYWLWLSSSATMFTGNIILYFRLKKDHPPLS